MTIKIGTKTVASKVYQASWGSLEGKITDQVDLKNALNQKASAHSPHFSGTPFTPTLTNESNKLQITNKEYVDTEIEKNKINEETLVHKDGIETITGAKTFTTQLSVKNQNIDSTIAPTSNTFIPSVRMHDKNGTYVGSLRTTYYTDGTISTDTQVSRIVDGVQKYGEMGIRMGTNGSVYTYAPTPATSDNSTKIATTAWATSKIGSDTRIVHTSGNETINGVKTFTETIQGTAYRAQWGDLAEFYETDYQYPKGTLVKFGGEKEITIADDEVNAVITSEPGFILNAQMENGQPIALCGRVPVRVIGKVNKFDYLTLSDIPGVARVREVNDICSFTARALEQKDSEDEGLILCVVRFNP